MISSEQEILSQADRHLNNGKPAKAPPLFSQLMQRDPDNPVVLGRFFRNNANDFPSRRQYLRVAPAPTETLRRRYARAPGELPDFVADHNEKRRSSNA